MPELQDGMDAEQVGPERRKLTWQEMYWIKKKRRNRERQRKFNKRHKGYGKKYAEKAKLKNYLETQEQHPEKSLRKRKFWIIIK